MERTGRIEPNPWRWEVTERDIEISDDAMYVAFASDATNLIFGDTNAVAVEVLGPIHWVQPEPFLEHSEDGLDFRSRFCGNVALQRAEQRPERYGDRRHSGKVVENAEVVLVRWVPPDVTEVKSLLALNDSFGATA